MIPGIDLQGLTVILIAFLSIILGLVPSIPAVAIKIYKEKTIKIGFFYPVKACIFIYGIVALTSATIYAPISIINTFLTPVWHAEGYEKQVIKA